MERLKRIDISDRLRLLIPLEVAQRYNFGGEVRYEETVLFYGSDSFFHVEVLRWLWAYATEFGGPAAITRAQGARENSDNRVAGEVKVTASQHSTFADGVQIAADDKRYAAGHC